MTTSAHVYAAVLIGSPDLPLNVKGGTLTLDAGVAPLVQGDIRVSVPSVSTLAALDPRLTKRIRVSVTATFPLGVQTRTFDLGLRDRDVSHGNAEVTLSVMSDEALLMDRRALADDATPVTYQASLRALVNYVLGASIAGAALNTSLSAADVAVPALADSSNLIRNPRAGVNTTDWASTVSSGGLTPTRQATGGPAYAPTYMAYLSNASVLTNNPEIYIAESAVSISTGRRYVLSVGMSGATGRVLILDAVCFDASGNITGFIPAINTTMLAGGAWSRAVTAPFEAYKNTAKIRVRVRAAQLGGSEYVNVTGWRLSDTTGDLAADALYFDGSTADTAQYDYEWAQTAHASISTRKVLVDAATPSSLMWRAGQSAMDFLAPIVQRFGQRLVCNEARVWTLRDANFRATGQLDIRHAINLLDGTDRIDRERGLWFDAQVTRYTDPITSVVRIDSYALSGSPSLVNLVDIASAYPGPGRSLYAVQRAVGRGREVSATAVSDWTATVEQVVMVRLDAAPVQVGITQRVTFNLDNDEMTLNTRTTELGVGSIDLLAGTIDGLVGTIDGL